MFVWYFLSYDDDDDDDDGGDGDDNDDDDRGRTEDIISYFTLMSSEMHYYDIIEKMGPWTLMSSEV